MTAGVTGFVVAVLWWLLPALTGPLRWPLPAVRRVVFTLCERSLSLQIVAAPNVDVARALCHDNHGPLSQINSEVRGKAAEQVE